jgi:hypothetical protein
MSNQGKTSLSALAVFLAGISLQMAAPVAHAQGPRPNVYCASNGNQMARCPVAWRDAQLVQQKSQASCVRGRTWGFDRGGIWVNGGCRAEFADVRGGWGPPPGGGGRAQIRCESGGNSYRVCPANIGRGGNVRIVRQLSNASCRQGDSWGWQPDGIWVNRGCRADFVVDQRW